MNSKMINKSELIDIFNHSDFYEIPTNYDIPYINHALSIGQLTNLNKDNVEYSWCHYMGKLGSFRYKEPNPDNEYVYKEVIIELDNISDIYECDETTNYCKIHECLGLTFIPNKLSTIPLYSLVGYDNNNDCWLIFSNDDKEPTKNTRPTYYYNNLISL
jgi:hypothetical protein